MSALSQPLCMTNVAIGTLASSSFGVPDVLSHFSLRQVRGLLPALNRCSALAKEGARSLSSVPTLRALCMSDW